MGLDTPGVKQLGIEIEISSGHHAAGPRRSGPHQSIKREFVLRRAELSALFVEQGAGSDG
jgi:hypothetical protein